MSTLDATLEERVGPMINEGLITARSSEPAVSSLLTSSHAALSASTFDFG